MLLLFFLSIPFSLSLLFLAIAASQQCVSSCRRLARNHGLPRPRHGAGIYQATELRNLDKSDMCEHASVFSLAFMFIPTSLNACSFFVPIQFPFFPPIIIIPQEEGSLAGRTAAREHLGLAVQLRVQTPSAGSRRDRRYQSRTQLLSRPINLVMFIVKGGFSLTASLITIL